MAPERVEGKEADERVDIYALGLILAEMATGQFFRFPKDLPLAVDRVIRRCLESDPDERWQSARPAMGAGVDCSGPAGGSARFAFRFAVQVSSMGARAGRARRDRSRGVRASALWPAPCAAAVSAHEHRVSGKVARFVARRLSWDIAPDGKRFLIISDKSQGASSLNVILNWRPREPK
jgi:hypothetical protein